MSDNHLRHLRAFQRESWKLRSRRPLPATSLEGEELEQAVAAVRERHADPDKRARTTKYELSLYDEWQRRGAVKAIVREQEQRRDAGRERADQGSTGADAP